MVSRGQAASKCLKCGQPGHWAASCPQNTTRSSFSMASNSTSKKHKTDGAAMMSATWPRSISGAYHLWANMAGAASKMEEPHLW